MNVRISIVTVCYNSVLTISETFDSVLNQRTLPYEYIVIDGGSVDGTNDIIKKYHDKFMMAGVKFSSVSEKDSGLYDAMNKGLKKVTGNWIHFLNSDDYYYTKDIISEIMEILSHEKGIVYGNTNILLLNNKNKINNLYPKLPLSIKKYFTCPIEQPAAFYETKALENLSFDISYKNSADYKLWIELLSKSVKFTYVDKIITTFRVGGASTNLANLYYENIRLFKELNLLAGVIIQSFKIHLIILPLLKSKAPNMYSILKKLTGK